MLLCYINEQEKAVEGASLALNLSIFLACVSRVGMRVGILLVVCLDRRERWLSTANFRRYSSSIAHIRLFPIHRTL